MYSEKQIENIAANVAKAVKKDIATLVDADGHNRFINGEIVTKEITGITYGFAKWSLSGSHLLIVLSVTGANTTALTSQTLGELELPEWIYNKLETIFSTAVDRQTFQLYSSSVTTQSMNVQLRKIGNNKLDLFTSVTFSDDRTGRIAFDLLID